MSVNEELSAIGGLLSALGSFSSRRWHTRWNCDWSSDVCSSDLNISGFDLQSFVHGPAAVFRNHDRKHGSGSDGRSTAKSLPFKIPDPFSFRINGQPDLHHVAAGWRTDHAQTVIICRGFGGKILRFKKMPPDLWFF